MVRNVQEVNWSWDHAVVQSLLLQYYRPRLFGTPQTARQTARQLIQITGITAPAAVLDIGCGLGYHATAFARCGFHVMAFDPGDQYVRIGREHAETEKVAVDFQVMSATELEAADRFDLAWAGGYCAGALTPQQVRDVFARVWRSLRSGGWFVGAVAGPTRKPACEKQRGWAELDDVYVLTEKWRDDLYCHEHCLFVWPCGRRPLKVVERERMYDVSDLAQYLEAAGFADIQTYANLSCKEPAPQTGNFTFVCRRPTASQGR